MLKAYLDPNVINWARRDGVTGAGLRSALAAHAWEPYLGIHGIYELARAFLNPQRRATGVQNFEIVVDLDPTFCPPVSMLLAKEIDRIRTGAGVIPVLDTLNHTWAKYEVLRLSQGIFDARAESFIRSREAEIEAEHPARMMQYRETVRRELQSRPADAPRLRTFADVLREAACHVPEIIANIVPGQLSLEECHRISESLDEYPTIRSIVRANLYLSSIPILHDALPGDAKLDDYRHVIEASYADVLVTGDEQLANTAPRLHPNLAGLRWRELFPPSTSAG